MEFLDSGRKCWTLDSGLWTLDIRRYPLDAGFWSLGTVVDCFRTESGSSFWFCLIKYTSSKFRNLHNNIYITSSENFLRAQKWKKTTSTWQESYDWLWKERMDNKTSIRLQPSKSRKRSLTWAVTGCTNNEYNIEVWRDSLCEIHQGIFLFLEIIPDNSFSSK